MEVVHATPNNGAPFHNNDVREWSRLDSLTGVLERARLETDHWTASTANTSHKYNKVVDSRARSGADGNLQQQARRKLEVFQSQVPGGRIQVIKTQSISSSRWSHKSSTADPNDFEDLKLSLNPLDLTSEKSKASVGRSVGRRPPSRSRIRDDILSRNLHTAAATNFHRVSRLCNQIHENAVRRTINRQPIGERQSGDGVEIVEIENEHNRPNLTRTKSTSSDDLHDTKKSLEDLEDLEQLQNWRRTSKLRRSLQFPRQKITNNKPPDLPDNKGNVRKIKEDLETGRRLSTALRGNNVDLEALDQILKSISNSSVSSTHSEQNLDEEEEEEENLQVTPTKSQKRNSFVTVESIQAVRDRLRRTSSPTIPKNEDTDDGIVNDQPTNNTMNESRVKSYIYGMENIHKKNLPNNTGSLESRSNKTNTSVNRGEDWFTRRKSYGFEQMHNQQETISKSSKTKIESSTDSGICRSSEIVLIPPTTKSNIFTSTSESVESLSESEDESKISNVKKYTSIFENKIKTEDYWTKRQKEGLTITIPITTTDNTLEEEKTTNKNKRISLALLDKFDNDFDDENESTNKKHNKKVEFCKTEVHFAADSGRVNIVETDEKPPPTQNFRRRRRNSGLNNEGFAKSNLPVLHFGDTSYEKSLFSDSDNTTEAIYENINSREVIVSGNVTVNAYQSEYEEHKENIENEAPKGILKNKPLKPKPYILGDNEEFKNSDSDSEKTWGVRLKPTGPTSLTSLIGPTPVKEETPLWRSTVTVRNTFYDQASEEQPEFQKLLKQLRPTSKKMDEVSSVKRNSDDFNNNVRVLSPVIDTRRSSWSVADRIKQVEDLNWGSSKGYSTKVNFGDGEATVVENRHPTWPRKEDYTKDNENETTKSKLKLLDEQIQDDLRYLNEEVANLNKEKLVLRKNNLNSAFACEKLSSPQLVVNSAYNSDQEVTKIFETKREEKNAQIVLKNQSPIREKVLRQPKKSELAYFGVGVGTNVTPKVSNSKKVSKLSEKPDLLQFNSYKDEKNKVTSPIYENMEVRKSNFDSSILDELTKAADQILQAVNGYTDEEYQNKLTSDEEKPRLILDTISETKSWQQKKVVGNNNRLSNSNKTNKSKLKPTSSNSSIDSISRECRRSMGDNKRPFMTKSAEQKQRKKVVNSDSTKVNTTKARRLQRASSREALLQSHGSSSEDLAMNHVEVVRKPRLVKKTKTTQLTVSNGLEFKKPVGKREDVKSKQEERVPVVGLPEIRHKTAVSTIRSTAEKAASRERAKLRSEELKKQSGKKDIRGSSGVSLTKSERLKSTGNREVRHTTVTSQKKPNRIETLTKH